MTTTAHGASDGKPAVTEYAIRRAWQARSGALFSLLDVRILTGRTHQIRVHLSSTASPIVGDAIYSRQNNKSGVLSKEAQEQLMLAAVYLAFDDPDTGERIEAECELPAHMTDLIAQLEQKCTEIDPDASGAIPLEVQTTVDEDDISL